MNNGTTVVSYVLAALAGVCFVTGISLLSNEGSVINNGSYEETRSDA